MIEMKYKRLMLNLKILCSVEQEALQANLQRVQGRLDCRRGTYTHTHTHARDSRFSTWHQKTPYVCTYLVYLIRIQNELEENVFSS